jgi:hypothetical protein
VVSFVGKAVRWHLKSLSIWLLSGCPECRAQKAEHHELLERVKTVTEREVRERAFVYFF